MKEQDEKDGEAIGIFQRSKLVEVLFGDAKNQIDLELLRDRLLESLNAEEVKVFKRVESFWDVRGRETQRDELIYSEPLVAHNIRLQAQKLAFELLDAFPSQKHKHEHEVTGLVDLELRLRKAEEMREDGKSGSEDKTG